MKIKKSSLISYFLILTLIFTSVMPATAHDNDENYDYTPEAYSAFPEVFDFNINDSYYETTLTLEEEEELLRTDESAAFFKDYAANIDYSQTDNAVPDDTATLLAGSEPAQVYRDVSHVSDQEFFGEWDDVTETWKTVGKINYDHSPDLAEVEELVKTNSYAMAKDALLEYYQNRTSIPRADFDGNISWQANILWMKDAFNYGESPMSITNITNATEEYQKYTVDLMGTAKQGTFMLSSINKTQDIIEIASRESEYTPSLMVIKGDGTQVTLYPSKDTYIRGYDSEADYSHEIYGDSEKLYVKDSYYEMLNGTYKPYSSKSRRTYIAFDQNKIPSDAVNMFLTFYAKIIPEEGVEHTTEDNLELIIFNAYNQSWDEVESETNSFKPMTWADYRQAHYSWNGLPGGYDYKFPDNFPSEGYYNSTRFYDVVSLAKSTLITGSNPDYVKKSLETVLDFINDTNGQIEVTGVPSNRDQEQKHRITNAPSLIATYIEADILNGEALSAILKWLWEELTYVHNGSGLLYEGATTIPQANNYAETNRGFWMCEATLTACSYLPEYTDHDMWRTLADERLYTVTNIIINDDGCYQEPTFAYPMSVLGDYIDLWNELERTGHEIPDWYREKVMAFSKYILNIAYPDHKPPEYGEGTPSNNITTLTNYLALIDDDNIRYVITEGAEGEAPDYTSAYFEQLKLAVCRTGWSTDDSMLIMAAKNGGNHNHKDSLHIMFYSNKLDLLADTGMTSYDSNHPHFQWQRHATRSHNTIEIDGIAQRGSDFLYDFASDPNKWNGQSDLKLYTSEPVDRIVAWTDATLGFRHYRNVSYVKNHNFLIVSDMVSPDDDAEHTYTQNWHTSALYPADSTIDKFTKTGKTNYYSRANLVITQANKDNVELTLEDGYSRDSGATTDYFCYTQKAAGDIMYNTILCPVEVGSSVDISAKNIDTGVNPTVASAMSINMFKNNEDVLNVFYYNSFEESPSERTFDRYTTDSACITIEQNVSDVPQYLSMYNGSAIYRDGDEVITSDIVLEDIEIQFDGTEARITSKDEDILGAKLTILAPYKIDKVTINSDEVDFVYSQNKLYINNHEAVDYTLDCGYLIRMTATDNKNNSYPVIFDIPEGSVMSGSMTYPSATYSNSTFTVSFGTGTLSSCAKIIFAGHTAKNVTANIDGVNTNITSKLKVGSLREYADSRVVAGAPMIERVREDLVIWTKDITDFKIGSAAVSGGGGGGGGGTNAGSPGVKDLPAAGSDKAETEDKTEGDTGNESESSDGSSEGSSGGASSSAGEINTGSAGSFVDCENHWAKDDIAYMHGKGFVNGISENAFAPDNNVTRAEFAAMAVRVLGLEESKYTGVFADVGEADWYASVVESAYKAGIIEGSDGYFRPDEGITREEMAVILMRVYRLGREYAPKGDLSFADSGEIADWAREAVTAACELKLITGTEGNRFAPKANTTRAQATTVFARLIKINPDKEE